MSELLIRLRGVTKTFGEGPTAFQALKALLPRAETAFGGNRTMMFRRS